MIRKIALLVLALVCVNLHAQDTPAPTIAYKGLGPFAATNTWRFICGQYALSGELDVQVAKTPKGGLLKLSIETTNPGFLIAGTAYVFLTDNTIITCSDKAMREANGNRIVSYYEFSAVEMGKLKTTEIESIHFNIKGKTSSFDSQTGTFTAVNKKQYFATAFDKSKKSYPTAAEINALYHKPL